MDSTPLPEITCLLRAWGGGDRDALERLTPLVYGALKRMARRSLGRERDGNSLQPTALVNEAYLRLVDCAGVRWQDRAHFFALSAQMMRRILADAARARASGRRGGQFRKVSYQEGIVPGPETDARLLALDEALDALSKHDERKAQVVELRHYAGLSVEESAKVLNVSPQTVLRDWKLSRVWLMHWMDQTRDAS